MMMMMMLNDASEDDCGIEAGTRGSVRSNSSTIYKPQDRSTVSTVNTVTSQGICDWILYLS
jgi:hypothetical protein